MLAKHQKQKRICPSLTHRETAGLGERCRLEVDGKTAWPPREKPDIWRISLGVFPGKCGFYQGKFEELGALSPEIYLGFLVLFSETPWKDMNRTREL